ncbi:MAG: DMT family transporter [Candidatus Woesearchaeota archaeon]
MIAIFMGLIAMFFWGIADFLQALAIKKINSLKTMFFSNLLGFILTLIFFFYFLFNDYIKIDVFNFSIIFLSTLINLFAVKNFMKSYEEGEISIVTPISASYSIITIILAIIFLNEKLTLLKLFAILLCVIGIVLVSTDLRKIKNLDSVKGIKESVFAFISWGVYFFLISLVSKNLLNLGISKLNSAITLFFLTGLLTNINLITYSFLKEKNNLFKTKIEKNIWIIFIINFFLYNIAWIAVNYGISQDLVSIIAPVSSLYPAITVLLAFFILKEKLVLNQKIGLFLTILSIFLISL